MLFPYPPRLLRVLCVLCAKLFLIIPFLFLFFSNGICQNLFLTGKAYEKHSEINWNAFAGADRYEVYRQAPGEDHFSLVTTTHQLDWLDWNGNTTDHQAYSFYVNALNIVGSSLQRSDTITLDEHFMSDDEFLNMTQEYTFRYFYDYSHPTSGMARERLNSDDIVTTGGTGFGIMALLVGVHRGFITREEGVSRLIKIISFLQVADRFHGAFPHWMNGKTGHVIPFSTFDNGGDLVETAFLMEGLLCARAFFDQDDPEENTLRDAITGLWEDVEWDFYSRDDSGVLYWHWSPDYEWQMNFPIRGYNEALIVYLLAIASPTHPVDAQYYHTGWAGSGYVNGNSWYGYKLYVGPPIGGPLFFAHYSFMGFDPRDKKDAYANYFNQNRNHTLINRAWCIANPLHFEGYGLETWGLTASDDPWGYLAHAPGNPPDNGTITPAAGIPSIPYTPAESISLLKNLYRTYGQSLWGEYGFHDAFNPEVNWSAESYIAIDEGPIINMIENYRSGLLWNLFMSNPEISPALDAIGFVADPSSTQPIQDPKLNWEIYPTLTSGQITIRVPELNAYSPSRLTFTDMIGRRILPDQLIFGNNTVQLNGLDPSFGGGWIWVMLSTPNGSRGTIPVWLIPNP